MADPLFRCSIDDPLPLPIQDSFPDEHILEVKLKLTHWYALIVNYLVTGKVPNDWDHNERKKFFKTLPHYFWEEPELFYLGVNQVLRRCVSEEEQGKILELCHSPSYGGHYSSKITPTKVLQCQFYWPILFKDAHNFYLKFLTCQAAINIDKKNGMPLKLILEVEVFYLWGIDFMGPFPNSDGYEYILIAVDYVSQWLEVIPTTTNDCKVVLKFIEQNIFSRFGCPRAIISDGGTHFNNFQFRTLLKSYGVHHRITTPYHPKQMNK